MNETQTEKPYKYMPNTKNKDKLEALAEKDNDVLVFEEKDLQRALYSLTEFFLINKDKLSITNYSGSILLDEFKKNKEQLTALKKLYTGDTGIFLTNREYLSLILGFTYYTFVKKEIYKEIDEQFEKDCFNIAGVGLSYLSNELNEVLELILSILKEYIPTTYKDIHYTFKIRWEMLELFQEYYFLNTEGYLIEGYGY